MLINQKQTKDEIQDYNIQNYYKDNKLAYNVIKSKYMAKEDKNNLHHMWSRIALGTAHGEYLDIINNHLTISEHKKLYKQYKDNPHFYLINFSLDEIHDYAESIKFFWYDNFLSILKNFLFVPGGRINYAVGRTDTKISAFNCYYIPLPNIPGQGKDSLKAIYKMIEETGLTYASQGGVGNNLGSLRPRGSILRDYTPSPGPVSFMDLISINTNTIAQEGRRGANMVILPVWHPDIFEFITSKNDQFMHFVQELAKYDTIKAEELNNSFGDRRPISYCNISILLSRKFYNALINNKMFNLEFPDYKTCGMDVYNREWNGNIEDWREKNLPIKIHRSVNPKDILLALSKNSHESAEPGVLLEWEIKDNWTIDLPFECPNPCGEIPLSIYEPCDLGHLSLDKFVINEKFSFKLFAKTIPICIRFLDNIHTINTELHALPQQKEASLNYRRLGLGITGLADMFLRMKISYDSERALMTSKHISNFMLKVALNTSMDLAKEKGHFKKYNFNDFLSSKQMNIIFSNPSNTNMFFSLKKHGIRNCALTTIAPVGTGSIISEVSSGIEPIYDLGYMRKVKQENGKGYDIFTTYPKVITDLFGTNENLPEYAKRTAYKIDPEYKIKIQSVWQRYGIMNAISATVNLPENVTVEMVATLYKKAMELNLKGLTIYRSGSRSGIITQHQNEFDIKIDTLQYLSHRMQIIRDEIIKTNDIKLLQKMYETGFEIGIQNGERIIPEDWDIHKRPPVLPAYVKKIKSHENKKQNWYFIPTFDNGKLYEIFAKTNALDKDIDIQNILINTTLLAHDSGIQDIHIEEQFTKSKHQTKFDQLLRMVSLCLRHNVLLSKIVDTLYDDTHTVNHFGYQLRKVLSSHVKDGEKSRLICESCQEKDTIVYQSGCSLCLNCGRGKC